MPDSYEQLAEHFERIRQENVSAKERERQEFHQLVADHSKAMEFVREIATEACPDADCGHCLPCRASKWLHEPGHNQVMAKKRGYSDEFPTTREKRVTFMLDKIPPALWIRVKAKAKREGVSLRTLILGWCKKWVEDE